MIKDNTIVEIKEFYSVEPPFELKDALERLLLNIPKKYISGLATIILRDSNSLNYERKRTKSWRMGKKELLRECTGLYHEAWKGEPAWIEIFIDNVLSQYEINYIFRFLMRFSIICDYIVGKALYHELGHHISKTKVPEYGERENIADRWGKKLMQEYLRHRYWYLTIPINILLWPVWKIRNSWSKY